MSIVHAQQFLSMLIARGIYVYTASAESRLIQELSQNTQQNHVHNYVSTTSCWPEILDAHLNRVIQLVDVDIMQYSSLHQRITANQVLYNVKYYIEISEASLPFNSHFHFSNEACTITMNDNVYKQEYMKTYALYCIVDNFLSCHIPFFKYHFNKLRCRPPCEETRYHEGTIW